MQANDIIDTVLSELFKEDPSLKSRDGELRAALQKLLAAKPAAPHDDRFFASLRADLLKEFAAPKKSATERFFASLMRPMFALPAVAFAALLLFISNGMPNMQSNTGTDLALESTVSKNAGVRVTTAQGGFGSLVATAETASGMSRGFGGGGGGVSADAAKMAPSPSTSMMVLPPDQLPTQYVYAYEGEPLVLTDEQLPVLRRIKGEANIPFSASLAGALPNIVDFSKLDGLRMQNFAAFQDKPFGLSVYVDAIEESVSVNQYYPRWPHPEQECRDEACFAAQRLQEGDMVADDQLIAMANRFLQEIGISTAGFGEPEARADWRRWFAAATVKADYWFPDVVSVTYPMLVDGVRVVEDGGYPYGVTVNVNQRLKRADGVWNLYSRNYESAPYAASTDTKEILAIAERGGVWGYIPEGEVRKITVRLGTPERVLIRTWQPGEPVRELLAPGLRFPVIDAAKDTNGTPEFVTVPLIKDLLVRPDVYGGPVLYKALDTTAPAVAPTPAIEPSITQ